jgi:hypothetical protein
MYFACFHVHLRYGLTLWGGDPESIKIFRLQTKAVRVIGKVDLTAAVITEHNLYPVSMLMIRGNVKQLLTVPRVRLLQ